MAAAYQQQLVRICGKEETLRDAKQLLNVARSKTGPGSGHHLGKSANALPAICALLASERLGNNDVVKKVAQDVSCLRPRDFEAALSTVRGALVNYLRRKKEDSEFSIDPPATPIKSRTGRRSIMEQGTPSPRKSMRGRSYIAGPSTPSRRGTRLRPNRAVGSDVEMEDAQMTNTDADADSRSSEDEEVKPPACRHNQPVLADRLFYHYQDPRVFREWEVCEKNMKALLEKYGDPFGQLTVH